MARQSTTPVQFSRQVRPDRAVWMSSGRAGLVNMLGYIPFLRGDSGSGRFAFDLSLAEMPRPLLNAVVCNAQAWFVPKSAHPQFAGHDEFMHSYHGEQIKALGAADRNPPAFFFSKDTAPDLAVLDTCDIFRQLGIHLVPGEPVNLDLIDAYNLVYNFRLAAYSSRLPRRQYGAESIANSTSLARAFWPAGRFTNVVPDYERALIVGNLDLDLIAGSLPVSGLGTRFSGETTGTSNVRDATGTERDYVGTVNGANVYLDMGETTAGAFPQVFAEMAGQTMGVTLADIDMARKTQAFAKLRTLYAGNDATGFDNDDTIVAELMQGFRVPEDQFKRPWLLDSKKVMFGLTERHATDGASLDQSVSVGRASGTLSINVPVTDTGGVVIVTAEVVPERLDERQADEWLHITDTAELPDALRDVQRPEPVDLVLNRRLDARHTSPDGLYGYEPMNDKWSRAFTRLGGDFYQEDPSNPFTEQRAAIWQTSIVDPEFTEDHFLCPDNFPHSVFSDTNADAYESVCRHDVMISGLTQIGDVLHENNDDYDAVTADVPEGTV